jgi:hypothetical protein
MSTMVEHVSEGELAGRSSVYKLPADDGVSCGNNQSGPHRINREALAKNTSLQR